MVCQKIKGYLADPFLNDNKITQTCQIRTENSIQGEANVWIHFNNFALEVAIELTCKVSYIS